MSILASVVFSTTCGMPWLLHCGILHCGWYALASPTVRFCYTKHTLVFHNHLYLHHWSRLFWWQSSGVNFILRLLTFRDIQMEYCEYGNCFMNEQVGRTWAGLHKSTNLTKLPPFTAGSTLPNGMAYAQHRWRCSWQGWLEETMKAMHTRGKVCNSLHHSPCIVVPKS